MEVLRKNNQLLHPPLQPKVFRQMHEAVHFLHLIENKQDWNHEKQPIYK